mgnify:CR=1 FL=1
MIPSSKFRTPFCRLPGGLAVCPAFDGFSPRIRSKPPPNDPCSTALRQRTCWSALSLSRLPRVKLGAPSRRDLRQDRQGSSVGGPVACDRGDGATGPAWRTMGRRTPSRHARPAIRPGHRTSNYSPSASNASSELELIPPVVAGQEDILAVVAAPAVSGRGRKSGRGFQFAKSCPPPPLHGRVLETIGHVG